MLGGKYKDPPLSPLEDSEIFWLWSNMVALFSLPIWGVFCDSHGESPITRS